MGLDKCGEKLKIVLNHDPIPEHSVCFLDISIIKKVLHRNIESVSMITSTMLGKFREENAARSEFLSLIRA